MVFNAPFFAFAAAFAAKSALIKKTMKKGIKG